jgi:hypothetical protein
VLYENAADKTKVELHNAKERVVAGVLNAGESVKETIDHLGSKIDHLKQKVVEKVVDFAFDLDFPVATEYNSLSQPQFANEMSFGGSPIRSAHFGINTSEKTHLLSSRPNFTPTKT